MSEESRLGREQIETAYVMKQITEAGVAVWFYLEDRQRMLETALDKVMLSLTSFAAEVEREKARQRTADALLRKARAGHVASGTAFGYINRRTAPGGPVTREVVPAEAEVIQRIFAMVAAGSGFRKIAIRLNAEGVRAPVSRRPGRAGGWAPSTIRSVIMRDLYRGVITWNRAQRIIRQGVRKQIARRPDEWITVPAPALRIVTDAAWQAAHARLADSRDAYLAATGGARWGRPAHINGMESKYLLTGFAACGACGSSMFINSRDHYPRDRWRPYLGCVGYHQRGRTICKNSLTVPLADAEEAVLAAVERDVLNVAVLETSLYKALAASQAPDRHEARGDTLRAELARLDAEVARLSAAIAAGGELPALLAAMQERERRRAYLRGEVAALERQAATRRDAGDVEHALDVMREALTDWQGMLRQETPEARRALRALLAGRLVFTPQERDGERLYRFEGPGTVSKIIAGLALPTGIVTR